MIYELLHAQQEPLTFYMKQYKAQIAISKNKIPQLGLKRLVKL